MKKTKVIVSVAVLSAGIMGAGLIGAAHAGSGCLSYQQGELAKLATPINDNAEQGKVDPALLALLQKQRALQQNELQSGTTVIYN